jgi:hypothetical protein
MITTSVVMYYPTLQFQDHFSYNTSDKIPPFSSPDHFMDKQKKSNETKLVIVLDAVGWDTDESCRCD